MVSCQSLQCLLGVTIDKKLNFKSHANSLCKKASQEIHALARISSYGKATVRIHNDHFHNVPFQFLPTCVNAS